MRDEPLWRLPAAYSAPVAIASPQNNLLEGYRKVAASILYERLERVGIIAQDAELIVDFHGVRDNFEHLNRNGRC